MILLFPQTGDTQGDYRAHSESPKVNLDLLRVMQL